MNNLKQNTMKSYQFILIILLGLSLYNCDKEDDIIVDEVPYKRVHMYDTNSSNKVIKFISQYYYTYDHFLITDPDSSDYLYNFSSKNELLEITPPEQDEEHLWKGIEFLKELLLDFYSTDFIKSHFPYSIILVDEMADPVFGLPANCYTGRYFCCVTIQDMDNMSPEEKAFYSAELHEAIWFQIGLYEENFLDLPDGFFTISFEYYNYNNLFALWPREQHYKIGIARNKLEQWEATWLPTKGEDVGTWIRFLIETPDDEILEIINTYEAMRTKYEILVKALERVVLIIKN